MMMRRMEHLSMGCLLFGNICRCVHQSAELVKDRSTEDHGDCIVSPAPLFLEVKFQWKLRNLCAECVRKLHRPSAAGDLSVGVTHDAVKVAFLKCVSFGRPPGMKSLKNIAN